MTATNPTARDSLYAEVTTRIVAELEAGRLPWVQPWDSSACGCMMPENATTHCVIPGSCTDPLACGDGGLRDPALADLPAAGGQVRRGEKVTIDCVCRIPARAVCANSRQRLVAELPLDEANHFRDRDRKNTSLCRASLGDPFVWLRKCSLGVGQRVTLASNDCRETGACCSSPAGGSSVKRTPIMLM